jgi:hypothetical protein
MLKVLLTYRLHALGEQNHLLQKSYCTKVKYAIA